MIEKHSPSFLGVLFREQYNFIKWKLVGRVPEILSFFFLHAGMGKFLVLSWGYQKWTAVVNINKSLLGDCCIVVITWEWFWIIILFLLAVI